MPRIPFSDWSSDPHARWIQVGNTFGRHVMASSRDYAFERIPKSVSTEVREIAARAVLDAIYGMMMLLDGVAEAKIDESHRAEYVLSARIRNTERDQPIEQFELAPEGDGLCMGFHGWAAGDFGNA